MSNHLAIATVSAALYRVLLGAIQADVSGATVTLGRPGAPSTTRRGANLYLFNVVPNAAYRNVELPVRRPSDGGLVTRPALAIDLHYLVSCYGEDATYEAQRVLGSATRALHARPVISRAAIEALLADPAFVTLSQSNLHEQVELVRLAPLTLSLDDLSKLWSSMFQAPHAPSVAYQASMVLLEPSIEQPAPAPPVLERQLVTVQKRRPTIVRVVSTSAAPVVPGAPVRIEGHNLASDHVRVRVAGRELTPTSTADQRIELTLPADVPLGLVPVAVVHGVPLGRPPTPRPVELSNVAALIVHPEVATNAGAFRVSVTAVAAERRFEVVLTTPVASDQDVYLELLGPDERVRARLPAQPRAVATATLLFQGSAPAGAQLVRVRVDDAESPLARNAAGVATGPTVTVP